jgi:nitrite reductase/ring-hydroxylating ferredoxin subunit
MSSRGRLPWHGWEFDIRTGQSYCDPSHVRVRAYDASVAHGEDVLKGPYKAETFKVSIEEDYVVINL